MQNEGELRELLKELVLEMYGLYPEPPETVSPVVGRSSSPPPTPTFSRGTAPRPSRFASEGSAIPGRKKILVGTSVRTADRARSAPGARIPGESDRDYLDRRAKIRSDRRKGLAPPKYDVVRSAQTEAWEMSH